MCIARAFNFYKSTGVFFTCNNQFVSIAVYDPTQLRLSFYNGRSLFPSQQGAVLCSLVWLRESRNLT